MLDQPDPADDGGPSVGDGRWNQVVFTGFTDTKSTQDRFCFATKEKSSTQIHRQILSRRYG